MQSEPYDDAPPPFDDIDIATLKLPPHSLEAEQSVLGGLLIRGDVWDTVADLLSATDFFQPRHRHIYEAMARLVEQEQPIDVVTLAEVLDKSARLDNVGGIAYLAELAANTPAVANIRAYADVVRERATLRSLIEAAQKIADSGFHPEGRSSADLLDAAERDIMQISEDRPKMGGPQAVNPLLGKAVERIDELFRSGSSLTGVSTGFTELDDMTSGLQKSDLIIVAARPSMGKCIVAGSRLVDPDSGERVTIDEIVRRQQGCLHSLGADWKLHTRRPSAFVNDGIKPTYRVTTSLGREIETTLTHPFLTGSGWKPLAQIKPGERIGVPRELPVFGCERMSEHEVKLLAYLTADGGLTEACPAFTNSNTLLLEDFRDSIEAFGGLQVKVFSHGGRTPTLRVSACRQSVAGQRKSFAALLRRRMEELRLTGRALANALQVAPATISYWRQGVNVPQGAALQALSHNLALPVDQLLPAGEGSASRNAQNALTRWLQVQGLWGKLATEKRIAPSVFRLPRPQLALFLNRLFACDGSVYVQNDRQCVASYASSSRELARDVQHLLLRFGVLARLRYRRMRYKDGYRDAWELVISHQLSLNQFIEEIGAYGKAEAVERARALLAEKRPHANSDSLPESVCDYVLALKGERSWPEIFSQKGLDCPPGYNPHLQAGSSRRLISRSRARLFSELFEDDYLGQLADSAVYWDAIVSIEATGYQQVYDLTVPDTHNFVAEDILVHNTTFAMNLVENAILVDDRPALVFSMEMPADQLMMRMLSSVGRIDQTKVRTGKLDQEDWPKLSAAVNKLKDRPLFIDDTPALTPTEVRSRARKLVREHGELSMIMIDYLQLMQVAGRGGEGRTAEISEISRSLKGIAKEFNCPVVALSQLNRALEGRPNKRPVNSDLRESGAIEQDADVIMFIYREEVYNEETDQKGIAEIIIGKQRNGPIGTARLTFIGKHTRFENLAYSGYGGDPGY